MGPTLLKTKCPNCGAPIRIDILAEYVTCEFCRHSSLLAKRGKKPQRNAQTMHFGTINVDAAQRARRVLLFVILGLTLLPIVGIGTCVAFLIGATNSVTEHLGLGAGGAGGDPGTKKYKAEVESILSKAFRKEAARKRVARGASAGGGGASKVVASDPRRVDGLELLLQARRLALKVDAHAKLTRAYFPRLAGGIVDVARGDQAYFRFGYQYNDPKKPAGEDGVKGRVDVSVQGGVFSVRQSAIGRPRFLSEPGCSTKRMWKAVVKSGVPANAIARVYYRRRGRRRRRAVWTIEVKGHSEYRRILDGRSCRVLRRR